MANDGLTESHMNADEALRRIHSGKNKLISWEWSKEKDPKKRRIIAWTYDIDGEIWVTRAQRMNPRSEATGHYDLLTREASKDAK